MTCTSCRRRSHSSFRIGTFCGCHLVPHQLGVEARCWSWTDHELAKFSRCRKCDQLVGKNDRVGSKRFRAARYGLNVAENMPASYGMRCSRWEWYEYDSCGTWYTYVQIYLKPKIRHSSLVVLEDWTTFSVHYIGGHGSD